MAQRLTYWLFLSLLLSLGFGQLMRLEISGATLYIHDLLAVLLLILNLRSPILLTFFRELKVFLFGITVSWFYALTQYAPHLLQIPMLYSLRLLAYLLLYYVAKATKFKLPEYSWHVTGLTAVLIGLLQYFYLPDMRWAQYLGWDDHLSRLILPHYDPTFSAVMLGLYLFTLSKSHQYKYFFLPTFVAFLLTYARSVYLSFGLALFSLIKKPLLVFAILSLFIFSIFALPRRFGEGTNLLRTYSIQSRLDNDLKYVSKYSFSLLIGRGLNTLPLDMTLGRYPSHATGPNSSYLYILTTTGVLGLLGWVQWLIRLYQRSQHAPMLIFFFLTALFNNVMFYPFALLWVLLIEAQYNK